MEKWISVKDKLPNGSKQVLCYSKKNGGYLFMGSLGLHGKEWCLCFGVTHWMPLPEFPKD